MSAFVQPLPRTSKCPYRSKFREVLLSSTASSLRAEAATHTSEDIVTDATQSMRRRLSRLKKARRCSARRVGRLPTIARLARRSASQRAREQCRQAAKQRAKQYKEAKAARQAREKSYNNAMMVGIWWGYDPTAGLLGDKTGKVDQYAGCYMFVGACENTSQYGLEELDATGRRTGRRWHDGSKWGVEYGGLGKAPKFESAKGKRTELTTPVFGRSRRSTCNPWKETVACQP